MKNVFLMNHIPITQRINIKLYLYSMKITILDKFIIFSKTLLYIYVYSLVIEILLSIKKNYTSAHVSLL
jgi:hypothetical protein